MSRSGSYVVTCWLAFGCSLTAAPVFGHPQVASATDARSASPAPSDSLRTFVIEKLPAERSPENSRNQSGDLTDGAFAPKSPRTTDVLRTTIGLGYVQGADWGAETMASGAAAGIQVQLDSLITKGAQGLKFDHGTLTLNDPDAGWRVDAGDIFSNLRGAARGGRLAWRLPSGREPALSLYGPRPGIQAGSTVLAYRDQIRVRSQTLLDAEVATDKSHLLRTRLSSGRFDLEASYRHSTTPVTMRDQGVQAGVAIWRRLGLSGSLFRLDGGSGRSRFGTIALRLPLSRFVDFSMERTIATTANGVSTSSAAMASVTAGQMHLFHRYQRGESTFTDLGLAAMIEREQFQSTASYVRGSRLNLTLQFGSEWRNNGQLQHWEELQTTMRLTRRTTVLLVTPVSRVFDEARFRFQLTQLLQGQYALKVEYGRSSPYQAMSFEADRPRFKMMLNKTFGVPTPMRGGEVRGRVRDQYGNAVAGARVALGPYTADSGADGAYVFRPLPAGEYDLTLDEHHLPADYSWDRRQLRLNVTASSHLNVDLLVAPLNAIHGRIYCDRNNNGRFDVGEGVPNAVVHLEDRVTASDKDGAYSFYNLWPAQYVLSLDRARLTEAFDAEGTADLTVTLDDGKPVTGADFRVVARTKPIIWREIK